MNSQDFKIYRSLEDLPAWNFFKARENDDLRYLYILDEYYDIEKLEIKPELIEVWQNLFDEYVDKFSFSKEHLKIMNLRRELEIAEAEYAISEDRFDLNKIRRTKRQLDELLEGNDDQGNSITFEEQVVLIEEWRKLAIDSKAIKCIRFFLLRQKFRDYARKSQIKQLFRTHGR